MCISYDVCYQGSIGNNTLVITNKDKVAYKQPPQTPPTYEPINGIRVLKCELINFCAQITPTFHYKNNNDNTKALIR